MEKQGTTAIAGNNFLLSYDSCTQTNSPSTKQEDCLFLKRWNESTMFKTQHIDLLKAFLLLMFSTCIGGVSLYACNPQINWNDTISFCQGNSIILNATNPNSTYYWSTGSMNPTLTVTTTGTYWVTVTNPCGSTSDTIRVFVDQPIFLNLGKDRKMCSAGNTQLSAPYQAGSKYLWSNGSKSHQINITQSGSYWLQITNGCGQFVDTVQIDIENPPVANLGPDINSCTPTTHTLSVTPLSGTSVLWNNGSTSNSISVSNAGSYWVELTNSCGSDFDTINIAVNGGQNLNLGDTIFKCGNGSAVIAPNVNGGTYQWSTGATTPTITVGLPGYYWLQYTDPCGTYTDTVYVANTGKAPVNLGADTLLCDNHTLILDAGNNGSQFQWSNGMTVRQITVDTTGIYWVGVNNGCGVSYDTISVTLKPAPKPEIGDTVFYCTGSSATVDAGTWGPTTSYLWNDGSTSRTHSFSTNGWRSVTVTNDCDTVQKNFWVQNVDVPNLELGPDTIICGPFLLLDPQIIQPGNKFLWSNGSTKPSIFVNGTGRYWVEITSACGVYTDTIDVIFLPQLSSIFPRNVGMCSGFSATLTSPFVPESSYTWSTGDTTHQITVNQPGMYTLVAMNACDTLYDTVNVTTHFPLNVDLGGDTTFCQPNILYISTHTYNPDSVRWSTGSRNAGLPISKSGRYWVTLYNACGAFSDTIDVQVDLLPERKLNSSVICIGSSATLDVTQPQGQSYLWNTGAATPSITVTQPGWYYVDISNNCGTVRDSAFVQVDHPIPAFDLGKDTVFCDGTLLLDAGTFGGAAYVWQDGTAGQTYLVDHTGIYYVTASNKCNSYTDTIVVNITGPPKFALGDEVLFCDGTIFNLNAQNPGSTYYWSTGDSTQQLAVDSAGIYWVLITNDCGQLTDTVEVIVEFPMNDLELGADTVLCAGQQLILDTRYPNANTLWSTGASTPTITVTESGTYSVKVWNSCGEWTDNIYVEVQDIPVFTLGKDSVICAFDGNFPITGPEDLNTYLWSNGDTTHSTVITTPGYHWLSVSNLCYSYTDTIYLKDEYPIEMNLGPDTILCYGESLILNPGPIDYRIDWSNNKTAPAIEVTRAGTYSASARNSCGFFSDTIVVEMHYPLSADPVDTIVCKGDSAVFDISETTYEVLWFDGKTDSLRHFTDEGNYPFTIFNKCGSFPKEFQVEISHCDCPFFIPNAFTPNGDGINENFKVVHGCPLVSLTIRIFNRWGHLVYEGRSLEQGWDGSADGRPLPMGVYNYLIDYGWEVYGEVRERQKRGTITLIR